MGIALLLAGIVLSLSASFNYIFETVRGSVRPNRVSWLMWTFAAGAGGWVTLQAGGDPLMVARIALAVVMPLVVFLASFWGRSGYWQMSSFDFSCGVLSLGAIFCWLLYANAPLSITFAGLADLFASFPTIVKSWRAPESESALSFLIFALSLIIVLPVVSVWDTVHVGFALYLIGVNLLISGLILASRLRKR
jgi:hypothetical protein